MPVKQRHLRVISRRFWGAFFGSIIALAVLVQIGRQAFPLMNDYRHIIAESLGEQLGVHIDIGEISAEWQGLRPKVILNEVHVKSAEAAEIFYIKTALAELSLIDSFIQRGFAWRTITFRDLRTTFEQGENLGWKLRGYDGGTANNDNPFLFDDPLDIFLFGRRVQIESASLNFLFTNGKTTELAIPTISLENDRFFHRVTAALTIDERESLQFVLEGYGDPRNKDKFSASGYLKLTDIPSADIFTALLNRSDSFDDIDMRVEENQRTNIEFWFKGSPSAGMTAKGQLVVEGVPRGFEEQLNLPERLVSDISGAWKSGGGWYLNLQDINVEWGEQQLPINALSFYGRGRQAGIRIAELDLTALVDTAIAANKSEDNPAVEVIKSLSPSGLLRNVDIALRSKQNGFFLAKMNVQAGAVESFKGSPKLANVDGYVEASLYQGFIDANIENAFSVDLDKVFDNAIVIDNVVGQLAWRIDTKNKHAYLQSSRLSATQGPSHILGAFAMQLPFQREHGEQMMTLQLEVDEADVGNYGDFLPKHVPETLETWLADSVQSGQAQDIYFFYRGSVSKDPALKPTYQLAANVVDAELRFDPRWPELNQISGQLFVDSGTLNIDIFSAETESLDISSAKVYLGAKTASGYPDIRISAHVDGKTAHAQQYLLASPVAEATGDFWADWQLDGQFKSEITLSLPVEFEESKVDYRVLTELSDNALYIPEANLQLQNVSGQFDYSKTSLAQAQGVTVSVWGQPFSVDIQSEKESGDIRFAFNGDVDTQELKSWLQRPELFALEQNFAVTGAFYVPTSEQSNLRYPTLEFESSLAGVELDLPTPLGKNAESKGVYKLQVEFEQDVLAYRYSHDQNMTLAMRVPSDLPPAIGIYIGEEEVESIKFPGQITISGQLAQANFDHWLETYSKYIEATTAINDSKNAEGEPYLEEEELLETTANIAVNEFFFGDIVFPDLALSISGEKSGWRFGLNSPAAKGEVFVPTTDAPLELDFEFLQIGTSSIDLNETDQSSPEQGMLSAEADQAPENKLTSRDDEKVDDKGSYEDQGQDQEQISSVFADFDLASLIEMKVNLAQLELQGEDWGRWSFDLIPIDGGIHLSDLKADFRELKVGANKESHFYWTRNNGQNLSYFKGDIAVVNVGKTLKAWDQEELLTSKRADFDIAVQWLAEPDLVSLQNLNGDIDFNLYDGSFLRATEAGENPLLRLIALFNFDTLARRIRLDFSDLAARGFAYDRVYSNVNFSNGTVTFLEPVIMESSSSRMQMAGVVDLIEEEIDGELVVTLPVANNVAVATAFLVGVPAGLGVYIVSKMLGNTVDKVSSINYSIKGKWEDPKLKVRKIFDDQAALKEGERLKKEKQALEVPIEPIQAPQVGERGQEQSEQEQEQPELDSKASAAQDSFDQEDVDQKPVDQGLQGSEVQEPVAGEVDANKVESKLVEDNPS